MTSGENTEGFLGSKKWKGKTKTKTKKTVQKWEIKKIWVATSALLLFWQLCPQELPQWQNTEWHVSCWQFCQHRILRYRSVKKNNNKMYIQQVKSGHKTGVENPNQQYTGEKINKNVRRDFSKRGEKEEKRERRCLRVVRLLPLKVQTYVMSIDWFSRSERRINRWTDDHLLPLSRRARTHLQILCGSLRSMSLYALSAME